MIIANALKRYVKYALNSAKLKPKELEALEEFVLNPQSFLDAAESAASAEQASSRILSKIVGASRAAEIIQQAGE